MNEPQPFPTTPAAKQSSGLSVTSLILGILSVSCLSVIAGIPAIITGHIARGRAKKQPELYGGAGLALGGLIMGYVSVVMLIVLVPVLAGLLLPALAKAKGKAQTTQCVSNMKQIGLAARIWSNDHNDMFPPDILTMSNELVTPNLLVCPDDKSKTAAADWSQFNAAENLTYEFLTPGAKEGDVFNQTAFRCPIHGNVGLGDGSVQQNSNSKRYNR